MPGSTPGGIQTRSMFEINGTLVIFIVSFLLFMLALNEIMLKPVGRVLEARAAKIKSDMEAAKTARSQADEAVSHYQKHLGAVRSNAQNVVNEALEKANYHKNLELNRIRDEGRKKVEEAKAVISTETSQLMEQLVSQEIALVGDISEKLLGEKVALGLDPAKVRRALEEVS